MGDLEIDIEDWNGIFRHYMIGYDHNDIKDGNIQTYD